MAPKPKYITVDGVSKTITQWSQETGIKRKTIVNRLLRGWNPKEAMSVSSNRPGCGAGRMTINGESHTFVEWANKIGIREGTLRTRYSRGIRGVQLLKNPQKWRRWKRGKKITVEDARSIRDRLMSGEKVKDICRDYGVTQFTIYYIRDDKTWRVPESIPEGWEDYQQRRHNKSMSKQKTEIDWAAVETRYRAGESLGVLSKELNANPALILHKLEKLGCPNRMDTIDWAAIDGRLLNGESSRAIGKDLGVSDKTVYKYVRKWREQRDAESDMNAKSDDKAILVDSNADGNGALDELVQLVDSVAFPNAVANPYTAPVSDSVSLVWDDLESGKVTPITLKTRTPDQWIRMQDIIVIRSRLEPWREHTTAILEAEIMERGLRLIESEVLPLAPKDCEPNVSPRKANGEVKRSIMDLGDLTQ